MSDFHTIENFRRLLRCFRGLFRYPKVNHDDEVNIYVLYFSFRVDNGVVTIVQAFLKAECQRLDTTYKRDHDFEIYKCSCTKTWVKLGLADPVLTLAIISWCRTEAVLKLTDMEGNMIQALGPPSDR